MTKPEDAVTVVIQTQIQPGLEGEFTAWQQETGALIATQPGFLGQTIMKPSPPAQMDWVILQRFDSSENAVRWLNSKERFQRVKQAQHLLAGRDDVNMVHDGAAGVMPAPASAVISTRVAPGQEAAYRNWEQRIATAQSQAPGFQGYRFEPPIPGVQEHWLSILRFDSEEHLQAWLNSPERAALLADAAPFLKGFHARIARSGFDQWFAPAKEGEVRPAPWKQNMIVLLVLFPVVYLFGRMVEYPIFLERLGLAPAVALFISNVISVILLNYLVPSTSRRFGWWLAPPRPSTKIALCGAAVLIAIYAALIWLFTRHV